MDYKEPKKRVTKNDKKKQETSIFSKAHDETYLNKRRHLRLRETMAPYTPPTAHYSQMDVSVSTRKIRSLRSSERLVRSFIG
jgi:hypothetical protein